MIGRLVVFTLALSALLLAMPASAQQASVSVEVRSIDDSLSEILQELARLEGASENASMATCRRMHRDIAELRQQVASLRDSFREITEASLSVSFEVSDRDSRRGRRERRERSEPETPPAPPPVAVPVPEPVPEPVGPTPISETDFRRLLSRIDDETFASGKLRVLDDAADFAWLTAAQVVEILGLFTHSSDQIKALKLIANNIVDHENAFEIYGAFTFDSDKEKARKILRAARD